MSYFLWKLTGSLSLENGIQLNSATVLYYNSNNNYVSEIVSIMSMSMLVFRISFAVHQNVYKLVVERARAIVELVVVVLLVLLL